MEPSPISAHRPDNLGTAAAYATAAMAESLRFDDEIHTLIHAPTTANSSFTALLGLPSNQALQLLHEPSAIPGGGDGDGAKMWRLGLPVGCSPTFPSNAALVERAARYSVFDAAAEDSPASSSGGGYSPKPKTEPPDSGGQTINAIAGERPQRTAKRKESEKNGKVRGMASKKSKSAEESTGGDEKLPYVHVRARRGQATDSHSLAERARREKINARMKLLQDIVPGCSKISGTALVLDEIINHVQCLQRQVEFLSMRLAAVNPRVDFSGLDSFLTAEFGRVTAGGTASAPPGWSLNGRPHQHQVWHVDSVRQHEQSLSTMSWAKEATNSSLSFIPTAPYSTPVPCSSSTAPSLTYQCAQTN